MEGFSFTILFRIPFAHSIYAVKRDLPLSLRCTLLFTGVFPSRGVLVFFLDNSCTNIKLIKIYTNILKTIVTSKIWSP